MLAFRLARRELRVGLKGFAIFLVCLALGVAVIAGVGSLATAVTTGMERDAREMLGGDLDVTLAYRAATPEQQAYLGKSGDLSEIASMRGMARTISGESRSLIELKGVDKAYPLYGEVTLDPPQDLATALAKRDGKWGAVVAPELISRLGLKVGDPIRIGEIDLEIRAAIVHEPDAVTGFVILGPRVLTSLDALRDTGLVIPGSLISYGYRLRFPEATDTRAWADRAKVAFPDAGWRIRDFNNAAPSLQRLLDRVTVFLTLVGLTALLIGGVGVGNAVEGYLAGKRETIATLKCLGASGRLIFAVYFMQILAIAALGIAVGLAIGAASPFAAVHFLPSALPVTARVGFYPAPLLLATVFGVLTTLLFSLWPLGVAREVQAASLFRSASLPLDRRPRWSLVVVTGLTALALAGLAIATAADRTVAFWFVLGAGGALIGFRLAAALVMNLAKRAGRPRIPTLRLALANLYRPGAPTGSVVASLGLGLTVLVALALVQGNVQREIQQRLPGSAPSFFFIDIQPDQVAPFDQLLAATPGVTSVSRVPSLRGRITKLNGVPVEEASVAPEARWAINSERGLTYAATPPAGTRIVAGPWWPADYSGPPLLSFDAELARGMGLKIGDTISVNLLGREITATIANLREIDWTNLGINFVLVFAPGTLEGAPQTHIATARATPEAESGLERAVTDRFPNVSAIRVRDALEALSKIIEAIGIAVRVTAAVTLFAGALVLAGAVAANHRRRVYEAVVLKVLGATRADVTKAFLIEYGLLGLVAAVLAAGLGTLASYLVLTRVMHTDWVFLPWGVVVTALAATAATLIFGYAGTWRALGAKAAPLLRNE